MALGRIESFEMEKGFGYIEHPEHGKLIFDFEACNFTPVAGDEVEVGEIKESYAGKRAKGVTCPAKPPGKG